MARPEKRAIVWTEMLALQQTGLGRREIVSDQRDKFVLNSEHLVVPRLTSQPEADGFIRSDESSLLFRNASASLRAAVPLPLRARAKKSKKGLEFGWGVLENADVRALFSALRAHAGLA
jgi:hypothetical protein